MKKIAVLFVFFVFAFSFLSYWAWGHEGEEHSPAVAEETFENGSSLSEIKAKIEELTIEKAALEQESRETDISAYKETLQDKISKLDEEIKELQGEAKKLQEKESEALETAAAEPSVSTISEKIEALINEKVALARTVNMDQIREDVAKLDGEIVDLQGRAERRDFKEGESQENLAEKIKELTNKKVDLERNAAKITDLEEKIEELQRRAEDLQEGKSQEDLEEQPSPSASETAVTCKPAASFSWASARGGVKSLIFDDIPWVAGKVGGALSGVAEGLVTVDEALTQYGGTAKLGLFSIFSALAQYQYTRKGSKNSQTQVFRAIAITLGQDMGIRGQLPAGLQNAIDPLKPFKREPLSLQQRLDSQQRILDTVLTMGGNPSIPGGFPTGTHEQLQRILKGSVLPGGVPDFSAPPGFPGVYDPNFVNFSRQAFNGFPPFPTTQTRGALLNPSFASNNPFSRGSTAASNNFKTLSHSEGVATVANVAAATAVLTDGVKDFSAQLEEINPQDSSLKSLIDDIPLRESRGITLQKSKNDLAALLSNPRETFLQNLQLEQATLIIQKQNEIAQLNRELFDATLEFRRRDFYVQPDEDGLMPAGAKDFSKNFERRTEALIRLQELTRKRAAAIEGLVLVRGNLPLFKRLQQSGGERLSFRARSWKWGEIFPGARISYAAAGEGNISPPTLNAREGNVLPLLRKLVPNWREIVRDEIQKIDRDMENNRKTLGNNLSQLRSLVLLDPDGVHEINAEVVQREKFNLKALAWQAKDNLRKLEKAGSDVAIDIKTRSDLESYKAAFSNLEKTADAGANQLARAERLQREKMERSDLFDHYQEFGKQILTKYAR